MVDNDGRHAMLEKSGTVHLTAGYHEFATEYYQAGGSAGLVLSYSWGGQYKEIGSGYCDSYYMGGGDGHDSSLSACFDKCNMSPDCAFVAFVSGKTCNRYSSRAANCVSAHNRIVLTKDARDHRTYQKIVQGITKQVVPASAFLLEQGLQSPHLVHETC